MKKTGTLLILTVFSAYLTQLASNSLGGDLESRINAKLIQLIDPVNPPQSVWTDKPQTRIGVVSGDKGCDIFYNKELKKFRVEMRIAFLNQENSELAENTERIPKWVHVEGSHPKQLISKLLVKSISNMLIENKLQIEKETFIRKDKSNKPLLICKSLFFEVKETEVKLLAKIVAKYFLGDDPGRINI